MAIKQHNRKYDLVVFGATGYTGKLTAEYITEHLPTNLNWAIAGRSESKLQAIADSCKTLNSDRSAPAIEIANVSDAKQVEDLASKAFVFLAAVGPYSQYGEVVFKACAEQGTHYFDVTGEVPWVRAMIQKYEQTAKSSGAIMVPQIGIESAPADLCTWMLADCLKKELNAQTAEVTVSIHKLNGTPSGGTLATVFALFDAFSMKDLKETFAPFALSPVPHTSKPDRPSRSISQIIFGSRSVSDLGTLTTSIAGLTDAALVERTWGLMASTASRKDQFYGPNFRWSEGYRVRNWLGGVAIHWALIVGSILVSLVPPFRAVAKRFVTQPGGGPDTEAMKRESIEYKAIAYPDSELASSKKALCNARYEGGLYMLTGLFLGQAAITVLEDDVDLPGGIYTPACLGETFVNRVSDAGFKMDVKILEG